MRARRPKMGFCAVCSAPRRSWRVVVCRRSPARSDDSEVVDPVLPTVFRVHCTAFSPNTHSPWLTKPVEERSGTGFLVGTREILTASHTLRHAASVSVELIARPGSGGSRMSPARIVAVAEDCDLALITVDEDNFWADLSIRLGLQISQRVLRPGEDISVVRGVPGGIDHGVYVSKAVVNTLDEVVYMYGLSHMLALEVVGTGFEPGDSGAPVCIGAQVVGMIHQRSTKERSIVQAVPGIVLQKFIDDYEAHGEFRGLSTLPVTFQKLKCEALRGYLGMRPKDTGVLLTGFRSGCVQPKLEIGDVLLDFDGVRFSNDGTVALRDDGDRVHFNYLAAVYPADTEVSMGIIRNGKRRRTEALVGPVRNRLHLPALVRRTPEFVVYAGLVFTAFSYPYLYEWGSDWQLRAPQNLLRAERKLIYGASSGTTQVQTVVMSLVLQDPVNFGYENMQHSIVEAVNGEKVVGLAHLAQLIEDAGGTFVRFDLQEGAMVVISREQAAESEPRILDRYQIPAARRLDDDRRR